MNKTMKTSCISNLASEIRRLKTKSQDLSLTIESCINERSDINIEISLLRQALDNVSETKEDI